MKPSEMSDEQLVRAIAEEVMGWKWCEIGKGYDFTNNPVSIYPHWQDKNGKFLCYPEKFNFNPFHSADHWWMVVERILDSDSQLIIKPRRSGISHWVALFHNGLLHDSFNENIGRAICEAALAAVRGKEDTSGSR